MSSIGHAKKNPRAKARGKVNREASRLGDVRVKDPFRSNRTERLATR
jgi:hypothetical protein